MPAFVAASDTGGEVSIRAPKRPAAMTKEAPIRENVRLVISPPADRMSLPTSRTVLHDLPTGRTDRLVTQVYFPGEPLNEHDQLLQRIRRKEAVIAKMLPPTQDLEPGSVIAAWDAVLARG